MISADIQVSLIAGAGAMKGALTDDFIRADPSAASSLSKPTPHAARTIWTHSAGVKTSRMRKAPGTPGTSNFVGRRRELGGVSEIVSGKEA